jgi:outer membrane lipoprotein-sorting protein
MRRPVAWVCVLGIIGVATCLVAAPIAKAATLEDILAKLSANEATVKSFDADVKSIMKMMPGMEMSGHIAVQSIVKDGKRAGSLMNMKQSMKMGEMTIAMVMVCDGEFVWTESQTPGGVMVMKMKFDPTQQQTGDTSTLRDSYDLKLVGEEEFDGQQMWILEGTPKAKAAPAKAEVAAKDAAGMDPPTQTGKSHFYIGQKDLMTHRVITFDKASGKEMADIQFTNIKLNPKLDPSLFKYTPPEGANVMDMTKGMPVMKALPPSSPK